MSILRHIACATPLVLLGVLAVVGAGRDDAEPLRDRSARASTVVGGVLDGATVGDDVACETASDGARHTLLVVARPNDVPASRMPAARARLLRAVGVASAILDQRAGELAPGRGARIQVRCADGTPVVAEVTLAASTREIQVGTIEHLLKAQLDAQGIDSRNAVVLMHLDADPFPNDVAIGGLAVVQRRGMARAGWFPTLHEWLHAMGALQDRRDGGAPNATPAGHCTDGLDVMCYDDRSSGRPQRLVCRERVVDCGGDDYFHPEPRAGSWLATHPETNVARQAEWLDATSRGTLVAPTVRTIARSSSTVRLTWAQDPAATGGYRVWRRDPVNDAWVPSVLAVPGSTSADVRGLRNAFGGRAYVLRSAFRVEAIGAGGMTSPLATAPSLRVPGVPRMTRPRVVSSTRSTVTVAWDLPVGATDLAWVDVHRQTGFTDRRSAGRARPVARRFTVRGLRPGTSYRIALITRDAATNASTDAVVWARTR